MALAMIYGVFSPARMAQVRDDPDLAPAEVETIAAAAGCRVRHYFFALDDNDFYAFVEGDEVLTLHAVRCRLMALGGFSRLGGDLLFEPGELLGRLAALSAPTNSSAPGEGGGTPVSAGD